LHAIHIWESLFSFCFQHQRSPSLHQGLVGTTAIFLIRRNHAKSGGVAKSIGGDAGHVHILASLKPTHCVAGVLQTLKANSSGWIHKEMKDIFGNCFLSPLPGLFRVLIDYQGFAALPLAAAHPWLLSGAASRLICRLLIITSFRTVAALLKRVY
jgi:hypothetical protein